MGKTIEQAQAALTEAKTRLLNELERDAQRDQGSDVQERRREDHLESLRNAVDQCERELDAALRSQAQQGGGSGASTRS